MNHDLTKMKETKSKELIELDRLLFNLYRNYDFSARWFEYFMDMAIRTSELSKDPITKVGAVIVKNRKILSIGFNGAPRRFDDSLVPSNNDSENMIEQKNSYMCHAELNAILNYSGSLSDLNGADVFVTTSPCNNCAIALAQVGIKSVIYKDEYHRKEITETAKNILSNCGISYNSFDECIYALNHYNVDSVANLYV